MTRGKPAPPAEPKKSKSKGHPFLRALLAVVVVVAFFLFVLPAGWFGRWITEPRSIAAVVGGAVAFLVLWLLALKLKAASDAAFYVVVMLATVAGGVLYVQDAGSAAVSAGVLDCPAPDKGTKRVEAPSGRQCVEVRACPRGQVPTWQADRETPTGKCARPRRAR